MSKQDGKGANLAKGARAVYETSGLYSCEKCFSAKLELDRLREENQKLKAELRRLQTGREVVPIGAHTPSSQKPFKSKSSEANTAKRGGAKPGHSGKGRKSHAAEDVDKTVMVPPPNECPNCGKELSSHSSRKRSVLDAVEMKVCKTVYEVGRAQCVGCKKVYESQLPLFPRALYSNALLSQIAIMHYVHGIPIGRVCEMLGATLLKPSGVFAALHRVAKKWEPALQTLIEEFRGAPVKHADETGWRVDGQPGWSWLFCTPTVSIVECQDTRSSRVPQRICGTEPLPGVLVVDRYSAYNKLPCQLQYCYAHLLREVKKLDDEFPENEEVASFSAEFAHLLSEAMRLPSRTLSDEEYYASAREIAGQIKSLAYRPSTHAGIQSIQQIFRSKEARLFQWVLHRDVPAHNNRAERELRQTVIARKVSFGSQSEGGARTRATLMSILLTAKKRLHETTLEAWFKCALDHLALDPTQSAGMLLPKNST